MGDELGGKVAVVTGGGRGIGRAIALRFAAAGANIVISSRTQTELDETIAETGRDPAQSLAVVADATNRDDARRPVEEAIERFGAVDVLVNNVGGNAGGNPDPFAGDEMAFEETLVLSLTSAWWTTRAALPHMQAHGGRIINIGSGASKSAGASLGYTTAKHGLVGFTKELARTGAAHGINANLLCPGWTRTSLVDFDRIAAKRGTTAAQEEARAKSENLQHRVLEPEELTAMALLLASEGGRGVTGQVISVDGGYKV